MNLRAAHSWSLTITSATRYLSPPSPMGLHVFLSPPPPLLLLPPFRAPALPACFPARCTIASRITPPAAVPIRRPRRRARLAEESCIPSYCTERAQDQRGANGWRWRKRPGTDPEAEQEETAVQKSDFGVAPTQTKVGIIWRTVNQPGWVYCRYLIGPQALHGRHCF